MELQRIKLDHFKRKFFLKYEIKSFIFKSVTTNYSIKNSFRYASSFQFNKIPRVCRKIQHTNLCFITSRSRGLINTTRLSRFKFRFESYSGNLPGFSRASW